MGGSLVLCLTCWKVRTSELKRRRMARRLVLTHRFAAKFVDEADSSMIRVLLLEWWKLMRDAAVAKHLASLEVSSNESRTASEHKAASDPVELPSARRKPCCMVM